MEEIHMTKKDFRVQWYSGTGAGGQYRNKHQNCCRIIHIATGLQAIGTAHRERAANQRDAFNNIAKMVIAHYVANERPETNSSVIRNYSEYRNEVHDKASGLKLPYKTVVIGGDLSQMIDSRRKAILYEKTEIR
jgi:protein subunit release factor A